MEFNPLFLRQNLTGEGMNSGKPTKLDNPSFIFSDIIKVYKVDEQVKSDAVNVPLSSSKTDHLQVSEQDNKTAKNEDARIDKRNDNVDTGTTENYSNALAFLLGLSPYQETTEENSTDSTINNSNTDSPAAADEEAQSTAISSLFEQIGTKPSAMLINPALYTANISSNDFMQNKIAGLQALMMNEGITGSTLPASINQAADNSQNAEIANLPQLDAAENPAILSTENQFATTIDSFVFENFTENSIQNSGAAAVPPSLSSGSTGSKNSQAVQSLEQLMSKLQLQSSVSPYADVLAGKKELQGFETESADKSSIKKNMLSVLTDNISKSTRQKFSVDSSPIVKNLMPEISVTDLHKTITDKNISIEAAVNAAQGLDITGAEVVSTAGEQAFQPTLKQALNADKGTKVNSDTVANNTPSIERNQALVIEPVKHPASGKTVHNSPASITADKQNTGDAESDKTIERAKHAKAGNNEQVLKTEENKAAGSNLMSSTAKEATNMQQLEGKMQMMFTAGRDKLQSAEPIIKTIKPAEIFKELHTAIFSQDKQRVIYSLEPETLGKMRLQLETTSSSIKANIEVETESARRSVEGNLQQLKESLQKDGLGNVSIQVSLKNQEQKQHRQDMPKRRVQTVNESRFETGDEKDSPKQYGYNTVEYLA